MRRWHQVNCKALLMPGLIVIFTDAEKASCFMQCELLGTVKQSKAQCTLRLGTTGKGRAAEFRGAEDLANIPAKGWPQ